MDDRLRIELIQSGKEMLDGGYISDDEFESFKKGLLGDNAKAPINKFEDLKVIRSLVDDDVITNEDYAAIKARFFGDNSIGSVDNYSGLSDVKSAISAGVISDSDYEIIKGNVVAGRLVNTNYDLSKEIGCLSGFYDLMQQGLIDESDYEEKKKSLHDVKYLNNPESYAFLGVYKEYHNRGVLTESEYNEIKSRVLKGSSKLTESNATVLDYLYDAKKDGCISEDDFSEFKNAFINGRRIPEQSRFTALKQYKKLLDDELINEEDFETIRDCIFKKSAVRSYEDMAQLAEFKKLLEDGVITEEEYEDRKAKLLPQKPKHKYVIKSKGNIDNTKKKIKKTILKILIPVLILLVAGAGLAVFGFVNQDKTNAETLASIEDKELGDIVKFGNYRGIPLKWYIADKKDNGCYLLVSKSVIGRKAYNDEGGASDYTNTPYNANEWSETSLRQWLNGWFYNTAFSSQAKEYMAKCNLINDIKEGDTKYGGDNTTDTVFILSYSETTRFRKNLGDSAGKGEYWLRNPYSEYGNSARITSDGLDKSSNEQIHEKKGVRPAIWISTSNVKNVTLRVDAVNKPSSGSSNSSGSSSSKYKSKSSTSSDLPDGWQENPTGNGYINDDGYIIYDNNGVTEITDGKGNWAQDTDGDGNLDTFGSDSWN